MTDDRPSLYSRRHMLQRAGAGIGALGLAGMMSAHGRAATPAASRIAHLPARAKRVIFLFMNGAPSHVDTFDPKPQLAKHQGQQPSGDLYRKTKGNGYMPSPFKFARHGDSGLVMSELLPNLSQCADDLCVIKSMYTDVPNHEPGLLLMHSGHIQPTRPSLGSWASYGLGSENENLPGFVVISPGRPVVGPQLWSNAFLPGEHQGTAVDTNDLAVDKLVANIRHPRFTRAAQHKQLELWRRLNELHADAHGREAKLEAHIKAMELAFKMQVEASDAFDVSKESDATRDWYGRTLFGQSCLLARRLAERDVRFIEVCYVDRGNKQPWDTHKDNNGRHRTLCRDSDQASAALIMDLKQRGLLDDTLVIWGGEFGRTPYSQMDKNNKSKPGRDHHHTGFSMFLAGGGTKGGLGYGETDDFGMNAVTNRVHVHDLHATILHLLGIDHDKLTYRYSGRDFRLTDVHGTVVNDIVG